MRETFETVLALLSLALLALFLLGDAQGDELARVHGFKAVMVVFYVDPDTLDIVRVQTYQYQTLQQCVEAEDAVSARADKADPQDVAVIKCEHAREVSGTAPEDGPAKGTSI